MPLPEYLPAFSSLSIAQSVLSTFSNGRARTTALWVRCARRAILCCQTIGEAMHLSTSTVKTHLTHVYDKLEVSERAAAVAAAMRRGLIE